MRRAAAALLGTTIGTSLLVGAKLSSHTPADTHDVGINTAGVGADGGPDPAPASGPGTPAGTTPTAGPGGKSTPTPGTRTTPTGTKTTTKPPSTHGLRNGTYAGVPSTNPHGTVKVTITISSGRMTQITATYPTSPARAATINNDAIPKLRQEALAAQSAKIATVSGATYTSESYRVSLQSALDRART
jgi:uncharacterized protein with FMN-binding domain